MLDLTSNLCPNTTQLYSIGKSVLGRELWVLEISSNPGITEPKPNFKFVANMHGDEPSGRQLLLQFAYWLCTNHNVESDASKIINEMKLFLMPTMNPDGYQKLQRNNHDGVDLNRNFPDRFQQGDHWMQPTGKEAPETRSVMSWIRDGFFVGSGNLHEGALVANYPWDADKEGSFEYAASPDDSTFIHLAKTYANAHLTMNQSKEFKGGITNGNDWYPVYGSMQDFNYIVGDCFELTLELNEKKKPPASQLGRLWNENKQAFVDFALIAAFGGFSGFISDKNKNPLRAKVIVKGIKKILHSRAEFGDFYRPLSPGAYNITISAKGFYSKSAEILIPEDGTGYKLNFTLKSFRDISRNRLRTMNVNEWNPVQSQSNWVLNLSLFTALTLFLIYGVQRLRKRSQRQSTRIPLRVR
eukprot:g737.t1